MHTRGGRTKRPHGKKLRHGSGRRCPRGSLAVGGVADPLRRVAYVSAAVRARVNDAAQQVGYRVNRLAQSLICEQSSLVGLVAAQVEAPFNAALVAALSQILPASGLQCLLFNAARDVSGIVQVIERILEFRARAIVILSGTPPNAIVEESLRRGLKVILVKPTHARRRGAIDHVR